MTPRIFAGSSNRELAVAISQRLNTQIENVKMNTFNDGEVAVEILTNVRGGKAYMIVSVGQNINNTIMEMALTADALRRSSINEIYCIIPYFPYARADRRPGYSRVPISARVVADMIETVGIKHVVCVDIHATQIQGFFHIPVDNVSATQLFVGDIYARWMDENPIVVSPDVGGVARARALAKLLDNADLAIIDKRRPMAGVAEVMHIIGDVKDKTCIVVDDMVDTAGTLAKGVDALIDIGGAKKVVAYATHGVLSGKAYDNLAASKITELVVTDTIPIPAKFKGFDKVRTISIAGLLAEVINRIDSGQSISRILD